MRMIFLFILQNKVFNKFLDMIISTLVSIVLDMIIYFVNYLFKEARVIFFFLGFSFFAILFLFFILTTLEIQSINLNISSEFK